MKKILPRASIYTLLIIIFTTLGIIGYKNRPKDEINEKLLNTEYYRYNQLNGNYDTFKITKNKIKYTGDYLDLQNCSKYTYTDATGIVKLDCNKAFRIAASTDDFIVINANNENLYFYKEKEKSLNGEFQRKYQMSIESYRLNGERELSEIEINIEKLKELLLSDESSYIYVKGDNCKNECTFYNREFKNFSDKNNLYYIDSTKITKDDIISIRENNEEFPENLEVYNNTYPVVFIIQNKKLNNILKIEGAGFDYSRYNNYASILEVNNE